MPLEALGIAPGARGVPFNLGVFRSRPGEWINWVGTRGATWMLDRAGVLNLGTPGG